VNRETLGTSGNFNDQKSASFGWGRLPARPSLSVRDEIPSFEDALAEARSLRATRQSAHAKVQAENSSRAAELMSSPDAGERIAAIRAFRDTQDQERSSQARVFAAEDRLDYAQREYAAALANFGGFILAAAGLQSPS
jgi:hypothetical protein